MEELTNDLYETIIINKYEPMRFYSSPVIPYSIIIKRGKFVTPKVFFKSGTSDPIQITIGGDDIKYLYLSPECLKIILSIVLRPLPFLQISKNYCSESAPFYSFQTSILLSLLSYYPNTKLCEIDKYSGGKISTRILTRCSHFFVDSYNKKIITKFVFYNSFILQSPSKNNSNYDVLRYINIRDLSIETKSDFKSIKDHPISNQYHIYDTILIDSIINFYKNNVDKITSCKYTNNSNCGCFGESIMKVWDKKELSNTVLDKQGEPLDPNILNPVITRIRGNKYLTVFCFSLSLEYSEAIMLFKSELLGKFFNNERTICTLKDLTIKYLLDNKEAYFSYSKNIILPHKLKPLDPIMKIKQRSSPDLIYLFINYLIP